MGGTKRFMERVAGEALAIVVGSIAGMAVGAAVGFGLFAVGELLAEAMFGFEGFGEGPFIDMAPRSRLRGGFLVLGAIAGIPASWRVMRKMDKADSAE